MEHEGIVNDALMLSSMRICTEEWSSAKYTLYFVYGNTPAELKKCFKLHGHFTFLWLISQFPIGLLGNSST